MNKTAAVFGAIWGVFAMIFSLFLFLVIFAPETALGSDFAPFGNSVLFYFDGSSFGAGAWAVAVGAFGLGALGLIGAGIVRQHHITAGVFLLISTVGMLVVCFQPFLVGEYSVLDDFAGFFEFGLPEQILAVLLTLLSTLLGFLGSLFSLAAKPKLSRPQTVGAAVAQPAAFAEPAAPAAFASVPVEAAAPAVSQQATFVEPAAPAAFASAPAQPVAPAVSQPAAESEAKPVEAQPQSNDGTIE